jgi:hypothetical protein
MKRWLRVSINAGYRASYHAEYRALCGAEGGALQCAVNPRDIGPIDTRCDARPSGRDAALLQRGVHRPCRRDLHRAGKRPKSGTVMRGGYAHKARSRGRNSARCVGRIRGGYKHAKKRAC